MTTPVVWTERPQYTGCVAASGLMAAIYGGLTAANFPLGIYGAAELAEFERQIGVPQGYPTTADGRLGLDGAFAARYGYSIRRLDVPLATALRRPGYALVLAGSNGRLPAGHPLRRWDPAFVGSHSVTVLTAGPVYLDPEAPSGFAGDPVALADVERWAYGTTEARMVAADEFAGTVSTITVVRPYPGLRPFGVRAGSTVEGWSAGTPGVPVRSAVWPTASMAYADAEVDVSQAPNPELAPHGTFLRAALDPTFGGYYAGLLIPPSQVDPGPIPTPAPTPAPPASTTPAVIDALRAASTALADKARELGG